MILHPDAPSPYRQDWKVCSILKLVEFVWLGTKPAPEKCLNFCPVHAKEFAL